MQLPLWNALKRSPSKNVLDLGTHCEHPERWLQFPTLGPKKPRLLDLESSLDLKERNQLDVKLDFIWAVIPLIWAAFEPAI
jgi:hypothetical protein